ncbi:MAG TPA: hypothetical protein VMV40_07865 [Acidiferrobacter sp.]|nr:hypothetical protein [Acidiferrobacter sp.]
MRRLALVGGLALALGTLVSIWLSVSIPNAQRLHARALTTHALHVAQEVIIGKSGPRSVPTAADVRDLRVRTYVGSPYTTVEVTFRDRAGIPSLLRGVELTVWRQNDIWQCQATHGHGAWAGDFPALCHYVSHLRLI